MYEFWYDYVKLQNGEKAKLCYMDTGSFIVHVKRDVIYKVTVKAVETRFHTMHDALNWPLLKGKNKKVIMN